MTAAEQEARITAYVTEVVAAAPALTNAQRTSLAVLLKPIRQRRTEAAREAARQAARQGRRAPVAQVIA